VNVALKLPNYSEDPLPANLLKEVSPLTKEIKALASELWVLDSPTATQQERTLQAFKEHGATSGNFKPFLAGSLFAHSFSTTSLFFNYESKLLDHF